MVEFATAFHHEKSLAATFGRFLLQLQQVLEPGILRTCDNHKCKSTIFSIIIRTFVTEK